MESVSCGLVDLNNESLKKPSNSLSANQFTSEETIQEELDDNQDDLVHQQGTLPPKRKLFIKTKATVEDEEDDEIHELYSPTQIPSSHRFSIASFNSNTNSIFSSTSSEAIYDQTHRNLLLDQQQNQINKRRKIMNEIVDSEIRYVSDLLFLKNHYIEPLLKLSDTPNEIIPRKVIHDIFYSHEGILATNQELRNQLQDRIIHWNQGLDQTGDIFLNLIPYLKIYSLYVTKFNNSMSLVSDLNTKNPEFAKFLKKNQHHPESHNLVLQAFLIMPVQRIPRYKMLLEDLFKHTPVDHADYENLKKAIAMVSEVATYVNETIREHEMMLKMVDIQKSLIGLKENLLQPGRKFIKRGGVKKICRRADQPRELFLFSDIIIYGSPSLLEDHFHFHRLIPLENCRLVDSPSSDLSTQYVFQIVSREKSFAVYTDTLELKVEWMSAIQGAISDWWLAHDTIQRDILPSTSPSVEFDAPVWMPDKHALNCLVCFKKFSFFIRRHHCRSCGIVACHGCSRNSFFIPNKDGEKKSRVCDTCLPSLIEERRFRVHIPPSIDFLDSPTDRRNSSSFEYSQPTIRDKRTSGLWGRFSMDSGGLSRASSSSMDDSVEIGGNFKNTIHLSSSKFETSKCGLCLESFSLLNGKHDCKNCHRQICKSCLSKQSNRTLCDPCTLNVDPRQVIVNPEGGGWSYYPS
ncbi:Dbl homology domain-containing protein [Globomyces pollinis-pini]|nr:Dbl homology domain-containing protein [Globomyces pollinis-pini]